MEDLFPVIFVIIAVIGSILSSSKAAKAQKEAEARRFRTAVAASTEAAMKKQTVAAPQPKSIPLTSYADVPGQVITPTVHVHVQPNCEVHDRPGSLGVTSMEGKDPCHEDQLTIDRSFDIPAPTEGGLTFQWSGSSMVNAVVMQEVLTRPSERNALRRAR